MIAPWKISGVALLLFAAGVLTGGLLLPRVFHPPHDHPPRGGPFPENRRRNDKASARPPGWQRMEAIRRLEEQVQLRSDQQDRIRSLIRESEQRIRADWEPVAPRIQAEIRELRKRIDAELDPQQRQRFDALLERREPGASPRPQRRPETPPDNRGRE